MGGMKVAESQENFERETPRPEPASAPATFGRRFQVFGLIAALLAAACAGASVYFLFTARPAGTPKLPVNVWMGVGAAVAVALMWIVLKRVAPRLPYRNPGQGRWARLSAYVGLGIIALFGAVALHRLPGIGSRWYLSDPATKEMGLASWPLLGVNFTLQPIFFPAAAFFLGSMVAIHLFLNRPRAEAFLTETQGEMRRVSWPTRREWVGSTIVVVVLVVVLSFFLYGVDEFVLSPLMQKLRIGF
jgi:preprotein translocase SecE subunit